MQSVGETQKQIQTKFRKVFVALSIAGLLASLNFSATAAEPVETPEIRAAAQKAVTRSDHEAVAKFYEDAARQMQAKLNEQKELLEHYEKKKLSLWQTGAGLAIPYRRIGSRLRGDCERRYERSHVASSNGF